MVTENFHQVSNSVWTYSPEKTASRISFIVLDNFIVAIDSGWHTKESKLAREYIEKITNLKVKYLILTHAHGDHTWGSQYFKDCEIISAIPTYDILKDRIKTRENYRNKDIKLASITFKDEYELKDKNKIVKIIETGGHIAGSVFVFYPDESVIIAGDNLFSEMYPFGGEETADPYIWIEALQRMINLTPHHVIPGSAHHGYSNHRIRVGIHQRAHRPDYSGKIRIWRIQKKIL